MEERRAVGRRGPSLRRGGRGTTGSRDARGGGGAVQPSPAGTACRARRQPGSAETAQDGAVDFPGLPGGGAGLLAAGSWIWYLLPAGRCRDPFEYRYDYGWEEEEDSVRGSSPSPPIRIGEGAVLEVETDHGRELTAQEIYQRVNPSVVTVMAQLEDGVSVGTGVIFRSDGYILTNYHVLAGGTGLHRRPGHRPDL